MASPIEVIKQGIEAGDWKKVVQGYNRLSGDKLKPPKGGIVVEMRSEDIPDRVRAEIERPLTEAIQDAIRQLTNALSTDDDDNNEQEEGEGDDDEDEEEPSPFEDDPGESVEARASEARAILRGERPLPDFTHVHAGVVEADEHPELGRKCRTEPFQIGSFKNEFVDDGRTCRSDIKVDRKLTRGLRPSQRRPPVRKVKVKCFKCEKHYTVDPEFAPKKIEARDGTKESTTFVCDGCMKRTVA